MYLFVPTQMPERIPPIGGKARNLLRLQQAENVPAWIAVSADYFGELLTSTGLMDTFEKRLASGTDLQLLAPELQDEILAMPLGDAFKSRLEQLLSSELGAGYLSVRSSAADEDGATHSFAGIHESYLYVRGFTSVCEHIKKVWASGYDARALSYRKENGLPLHPVPMAVIVQRMVDAVVSGVVFTAEPTSGNPMKLAVSSLWGLGEGLVSAGLDADLHIYDKSSKTAEITIAEKSSEYQLDTDAGAGLTEHPVAKERALESALSDSQLQQVIEAALRIERDAHRPQDIEFCFDKDRTLFILQTRDITTADEYGPAAGNRQIWDNSNIIESYSGVTSPMTFSFIRHAYAVVYHCFSEVMGIPRATIEENQTVYRNMLGLFEGQVYYNLPNWYRLVKQFPGYSYNKTFMESMMGVKEKVDGDGEPDAPANALQRYFVALPKLLTLVVRMLLRFGALKRRVPAFNQHFDHYYSRWVAMDFAEMPPHELMQVYADMEKHLLRNWKTPIINDFYVMIFYGTLKSCCRKWCGDTNGTLQNNLICGEGGIASTEPTRMLMSLARDIKRDPALTTLFLEQPPQRLLTEVSQGGQTMQHIREGVTRYLDLYGFRCMNELKLEEPSLHETPEFVYQMLANYVRMDDAQLDTNAMKAREKKIRSDAEGKAFAALRGPKRLIFKKLLHHARTGVKNRENLRFARTKIYGLLRQLLNAVGNTLEREGVLAESQEIYYLTIDELWDYVKGTAVTTDLRGLVALRRAEFNRYRQSDTSPADHFDTYGMAYHRNNFRPPTEIIQDDLPEGTLKGVGCSPGKATGIARIVESPRSDIQLNGEILVAGRTDPGWVPLYPSVSGILIERGSILSHSAIVAREMGIPAIVGIPNLLKTIKDHQEVSMDASAGTVILERSK